MIPQMQPWFDQAERDAIFSYMETDAWLTEYEKTAELEYTIADYVGSRHCIMTPSCTLAMYAVLMCLNAGPGDLILVPDFTMIATANAIRMTGAKPVFIDVRREDLCMDIVALRNSLDIGSHVGEFKAIVLVSLNGRSPDMPRIVSLATEFGISLVEDAAQSLGSYHNGQHLGTFGKAGCFSFSCQKVITTGNGGCIVTDDDKLAEKLRLFKNFGRRAGGSDVYEAFGINLKYTDLQAVIGIEQMRKLPWRIRRKKEIYIKYCEGLAGTPGLKFISTDLNDTSPWFMDVLVEDRNGLMAFLVDNDIGSRAFYPALHKTPIYANMKSPSGQRWGKYWFPQSEYLAEHGLWLPSSSSLTDGEITRVCQKVKEYYG